MRRARCRSSARFWNSTTVGKSKKPLPGRSTSIRRVRWKSAGICLAKSTPAACSWCACAKNCGSTTCAESAELPDHISHVLAIVAAMPDDEATRFVTACVQPAVEKMNAALDREGHALPACDLLRWRLVIGTEVGCRVNAQVQRDVLASRVRRASIRCTPFLWPTLAAVAVAVAVAC